MLNYKKNTKFHFVKKFIHILIILNTPILLLTLCFSYQKVFMNAVWSNAIYIRIIEFTVAYSLRKSYVSYLLNTIKIPFSKTEVIV